MPGFDPAVVEADPPHRSVLIDLLGAALTAADPGAAVSRSLRCHHGTISVDDASIPLPRRRVTLLALGKAALAMSEAAVAALPGCDVTGVVVSPSGTAPPGLVGMRGPHPVPDAAAVAAGRALLDAARADTDIVLCLISGGGSAMAEVPAPGLTIADLASVTDELLRSGAPITEINTVRRQLSAIKGGRLALGCSAPVVSLIVSDVIGDPPAVVAGGPTVDDQTTGADALGVLERWGVTTSAAVERRLLAAAPISALDPPPITRVVAGGALAASAVVVAARARGIDARVGGTGLEGEARRVGIGLARAALDGEPGLTVYAGETTVTVRGGGVGGRNQEVALAAATELDGVGTALVCSFATDGVDGPTDAAGGIGDGGTVGRGSDAGLDAAAALERNDALRFLVASGDLLRCGPTGTNVGDLMITWRW